MEQHRVVVGPAQPSFDDPKERKLEERNVFLSWVL